MAALAGISVLIASVASAQVAPFHDAPAAIEGDRVTAAAVGSPDERIGRFTARRASARRMARRRAEAMIHAWADDALARVHAGPREARAVHDAIREHARVRAVRPLVDAGAVVSLEVPVTELRAACAREGLPWSP